QVLGVRVEGIGAVAAPRNRDLIPRLDRHHRVAHVPRVRSGRAPPLELLADVPHIPKAKRPGRAYICAMPSTRIRLALFACLLVAMFAGAACGGDDDDNGGSSGGSSSSNEPQRGSLADLCPKDRLDLV